MSATPEQKPQTCPAVPERAVISETEFLWKHTLYSAISSWLFAISGATNIGVLSVLSSKILNSVEKGLPIFRKSKDHPAVTPVLGNTKFNRIALWMIGFGGACMAVSNYLESLKLVTESQMLAGKMRGGKLGKKAALMEDDPMEMTSADPIPANAPVAQVSANDMPAAAPRSRNWAASLRPKILDPIIHPANRFRAG